jgi:diaminopimelate epimerase
MEISFWKMHGAGNDFMLVDDRAGGFPEHDTAWISSVAARRTGVGAEGVILLSGGEGGSVHMRFLNPDGRRAGFCGNGSRCAARLAFELGMSGRDVALLTDSGPVHAEVRGRTVCLRLPPPHDWRMCETVQVLGRQELCHYVNTGVPHAVLIVEDVDGTDVQSLGGAIRRHQRFMPDGANVNFIAVTGAASLSMRTYERGVEAETGACGSGAVASALVAARLGLISLPATLRTCMGYDLTVDAEHAGDVFSAVCLSGPADHVFRGTLEYPGCKA